MTKPFQYNTITTGSNFAPLSLSLKDGRTGEALALTGATVTVTVKDELTGEVIVQDGAGAVNATNPALVEFYFDAPSVAKIAVVSTWLVQWKITAVGGRVYRNPEPCRLPVRPSL
jgi:hypothetical protein